MKQPMVNTWDSSRAQQPGQWQETWDRAGQGPMKALVGWRGVVVWDQEVDPVDLARAYLEKTRDESCGQCTPCRLGTHHICQIMERICAGQGGEQDLELLKELAAMIASSSRCDIGQSLGKPFFDLLDNYEGDFLAVASGQRPVRRGSYRSTVTAPCMSACPSNVDVPAYLEAIRWGEYEKALAIVRQDCPMPGTIGRVCVRPCESNCRRSLLDQPLAIKSLKRFLADQELGRKTKPAGKPPKDKKRRVAIVGAGPAGLSCAYYLGRLGIASTIFEAQEGPGGMAAYGIPAYRLPRDILAYEASLVKKSGAEIRYGVKVGQDLSLDQIKAQGYEAIFLGVGAPESSSMRCEGEDAGYQCFMTGVEFLAKAARGQRPLEGKRMLVIGGGNVAMDCVRTALRLGFSDVNLLYRRTEAEMPADRVEIEEALEEGVKFHYLVAPVQVMAKDGKVIGLQCQSMKLGEPDQSGRRRPMPVKGSEFVIKCDAIIPAVGQVCVVDCVLPDEGSLTRWKTLVVDQMTFQSKDAHIFGGGDCVSGPYTLIAALAAGKKAARYIAQYLEQGSCQVSQEDALEAMIRQTGVFDPQEGYPFKGLSHQAHAQTLPPQERIQDFAEVESGLSQAQATAEARRCLRCYRPAVVAL